MKGGVNQIEKYQKGFVSAGNDGWILILGIDQKQEKLIIKGELRHNDSPIISIKIR